MVEFKPGLRHLFGFNDFLEGTTLVGLPKIDVSKVRILTSNSALISPCLPLLIINTSQPQVETRILKFLNFRFYLRHKIITYVNFLK